MENVRESRLLACTAARQRVASGSEYFGGFRLESRASSARLQCRFAKMMAREFDVTSFLTDFLKTRVFEAAFDLAKPERPEPPQPLPRFGGRMGRSCDRRFKVQFKRLTEIRQSFLFRAALTGNVHVQTLRNKPLAFAPDRGRKWAFHYNDSARLFLG
jgi:hypothetical protein